MPYKLTLPAVLLTLTIALAGCTGQPPSPASPTTPTAQSTSATPNQADQMFVTMMIPHHQQAIEMSDILLAKDGVDARVSDLAEQIKAAQGPEIDRMLGWLDDWGVEYDPANPGGMHHGMMDDTMDGMMSDDDMRRLQDADGADAGRLFLEQMIMHHEGAVQMARVALRGAQDPGVLALAQQVIDDQTAEIATMQSLLKGL